MNHPKQSSTRQFELSQLGETLAMEYIDRFVTSAERATDLKFSAGNHEPLDQTTKQLCLSK